MNFLYFVEQESINCFYWNCAAAGAVDEEFFANAFEDVPTVQIFSAHELKEIINTIATTIGNPEMDWDKRVDAVGILRYLRTPFILVS